MRLIVALFDRTGNYEKLYKVFERSCKNHMKEIIPEVIRVDIPPNIDHHRDTYYGFIPAALKAIESKEETAVADADLMFTGSITDVWENDFDIAVTVREHKMRYNTGLWFCRPTEAARDFITTWIRNTEELFKKFTLKVVTEWGGIDQQSLAETILQYQNRERGNLPKIIYLPCSIWNAEQTSWRDINAKTKVIHIKSGLRKVCLGIEPLQAKHAYLQKIVDEWRGYYDNP